MWRCKQLRAVLLTTIALWAVACAADPSPQPACLVDRDCGDGFRCNETGECELVVSAIGQPCSREADCGPGQACALTTSDSDGDGTADTLAPTCQLALPGADTGSLCGGDEQCATGACVLGRCTELCAGTEDCPAGAACVGIPAVSLRFAPLFEGCLQATGTLETALEVDPVTGAVQVPVPTNALSFTLVVEGGDPTHTVGVVRLESPQGELLYERPAEPEAYYTQPIRYAPDTGISSLYLPASSDVAIEAGVYAGEVASFLPGGGVGAAPPAARVVYRLGIEGQILNVNLYFLDLTGHGCAGAEITAARAESSPLIQDELLNAWRGVFAGAGIALGSISYHDIVGRPDLDVLAEDEVEDLLGLSERGGPALDVFFVRSMVPIGVLARTGGIPGPPAHGTAHSGVVLSADALCHQSWAEVGRTAAHLAGHYLGLHHNLEADGHVDPLGSTDDGAGNLMYFGHGGGELLTAEQRAILRRSPLLR